MRASEIVALDWHQLGGGRVQLKLGEVQTLAAKTANDDDVRWMRAKAVALALVGLVTAGAGLLGAFGAESVRIALAWLGSFVA